MITVPSWPREPHIFRQEPIRYSIRQRCRSAIIRLLLFPIHPPRNRLVRRTLRIVPIALSHARRITIQIRTPVGDLTSQLARHPGAIWNEVKGSVSKRAYLKAVRKYCPAVELSDLTTYRSANRAQAVAADGTMVDDFLIMREAGLTAILNAPSPAATGAFPIARHIVETIF